MSSKLSENADARRRRRRKQTAIKDQLRELSNQLSLLNHRVGARLEMKDLDLDCLDLLSRYGALSPSELARRAGVHPATMTGVLDRLERDGWVARERDLADRRGVVVRTLRGRGGELFRLYAGMNRSLDELCADYDEAALDLIADFLRRTTEAGRRATDELGEEST
jgi:DNA-binding MarR family transcriptional regulator